MTTDWEWGDNYGPLDPRTERGVNTTAPPKVTEGQGVTTDWEWGDNYGPLDPRTERGVNTTAPPKVTEGQGVTTDWEWGDNYGSMRDDFLHPIRRSTSHLSLPSSQW